MYYAYLTVEFWLGVLKRICIILARQNGYLHTYLYIDLIGSELTELTELSVQYVISRRSTLQYTTTQRNQLTALRSRALWWWGWPAFVESLKELWLIMAKRSIISNIRHKDFCLSVRLVLPPLKSEMGGTGELLSNFVLLILKKLRV